MSTRNPTTLHHTSARSLARAAPARRGARVLCAALCVLLAFGAPGMAQTGGGATPAASAFPDPLDLPPDIREPTADEWARIEARSARASAALAAGNPALAEALARDVLALELQSFGADHPYTAGTFAFLAEIDRSVHDDAGAEQMSRRAAEIYRTRMSDIHPLSLQTAMLHATDLFNTGRPADALRVAAATADAAENAGAEGRLAELEARRFIATLAQAQGALVDAARALRRAAELVALEFGATHPATARARLDAEAAATAATDAANEAGLALYAQGRLAEAEVHFRRMLRDFADLLPPEHLLTLRTWTNLAATLRAQGRPREAEPIARRLVRDYARLVGADHPDTLRAQATLAEVLRAQGRADAAVALHLRTLRARQTVLGEAHPETLESLLSLALALKDADRPREAENFLDRLRGAARALVPSDPVLIRALQTLASITLEDGRAQEAESLYRDAAARARARFGAAHPDTLSAEAGLAAALAALGRHADAGTLRKRQIAALDRTLGPAHPKTLDGREDLALTQAAQGDWVTAERELRGVLRIRGAGHRTDHPETLATIGRLARMLAGAGRTDEAEALFAPLVETLSETDGRDAPATLEALSGYAAVLVARGAWAAAEPLLFELYERQRARQGETAAGPLAALADLATLYGATGRDAEAEAMAREVWQGRRRALGAAHPATLAAVATLATTLTRSGAAPEAAALLDTEGVRAAQALGPRHPATLALDAIQAVAAAQAGDTARAIAQAARSAAGSVRVLGETDPHTIARLSLLAKLLLEDGRPAAALTPARGALAGLDARFGALSLPEPAADDIGLDLARAAYAAAAGPLPEGETANALRDEAFRAVQSAQRDAAVRAMSDTAARGAAADPEAARRVARLRAAEAERRAIDRQMAPDPGLPRLDPDSERHRRDTLLRRRDALDREVAVIRAGLARTMPDLARLIDPASLPRDALQDLLQPEEALILIAPGTGSGDTPGLVWAITADRAAWAEIPLPPAELAASPRALRSGLAPGGPATFDRDAAHALYQALFAAPAIAETLAGRSRWLLVPQDGALGIPFNALVTRPPEGDDGDPDALRATAWLGLEKVLTLLPDVATLAARAVPRPTQAPPAASPTGRPPERVFILDAAPSVPAQIAALEDALAPRNIDALRGAEATETRLAEASDGGRLARARLVVFGAAQGSPDAEEASLSLTPQEGDAALIDAAPDASSLAAALWQGARQDDGRLTASEAARLRLNADLVILPEFGLDVLSMGVARGVLHAGADALLVATDPPPAEIAASLAAATAAQVLDGAPAAEALQSAMRAVMVDTARDGTARSGAHPANWAGFGVVAGR